MMKLKEAEKIVIAKPVARKPTISNIKTFTELLAGEVSASPPAPISESTVAAIRPRTAGFNHSNDLIEAELLSSPDSGPFDKVPESNVKSNVVYKPIAKLVSNTTISLLAKLRSCDKGPQQETAKTGSRLQLCYQAELQTHMTSDPHQSFQPLSQTIKDAVLENQEDAVSGNPEEDRKSFQVPDNGDQPASDGHNWRKYGQKQVKGSEYPRSYYKCTYPNCPVKKKVERTLDGQIAEIVYKGEHNHPRPHPLKHNLVDGQPKPSARDESKNYSWSNQLTERIQGHEGSSSFSGAATPINDDIPAAMPNSNPSTSKKIAGLIREHEEVNESLATLGDGVKNKRRKSENLSLETNSVGDAKLEPRIVVQNGSDSEIKGDGYRWRKYGQKVVKGNPYPRSYYRCTTPKCNVRKYVERTSEDPATCITTYEGRHNHEPIIKGTKS